MRAGCCETYVGRVGYGLARENLAVARRDARPVRRLPDVDPYDDSGLLGGAMAISSNRQIDRKPSLRHPHSLAVAPAPGSFLSVVRSGERLRWQHPRPSSGQGQTVIRRRPIGGPSGLARIVGNAPNARRRSLSVVYPRLRWGERKAQTHEGGSDGRPAREPRGQGVRRRSPQQAMGGRHRLHRNGRRMALPRNRD